MANTTQRYVIGANQDNTFRVLTFDNQTPTVTTGVTISTSVSAHRTQVNLTPANTGSTNTIVGDTTNPLIGDTMQYMIYGPTTSGTFSVTFMTASHAIPTTNAYTIGLNKNSVASFTFNGNVWVGSVITGA